MLFTLSLLLFVLQIGVIGGLPKPCRSWSSCNRPRCTPEQQYQFSLIAHIPCVPSSSTSSSECAVVDGNCTFTENAPNCTSWLSPCERRYRCTTVEDYMNEAPTISNCSSSTQVPSPDSLCVAINGSCQWYNPCRTWRGHCWSGYQCGSESDYWAFIYGPHPLCAARPPGWQVPLPPGECNIQNGHCNWTSCRSWLDWCQRDWLCGTNYEYQQYLAGHTTPCPLDIHTPPPEPGLCQFNTSSLSCDFNTSHATPRLPGGFPDEAIAGVTIAVILIGTTIVVVAGLIVYHIIARRKMTNTADVGERNNNADLDTPGKTYLKLNELDSET